MTDEFFDKHIRNARCIYTEDERMMGELYYDDVCGTEAGFFNHNMAKGEVTYLESEKYEYPVFDRKDCWVFFDLANPDHLRKTNQSILEEDGGIEHIQKRFGHLLEQLEKSGDLSLANGKAIRSLRSFLHQPYLVEKKGILWLFKNDNEKLATFKRICEDQNYTQNGKWCVLAAPLRIMT